MKCFPLLLLVLITVSAAAQKSERAAVTKAMQRGTCDGVPDIVFGLDGAERKYAEKCWRRAQTKLIAEVRKSGDCAKLTELPGGMALGPADEQRFILGCWLRTGYLIHDTALGIIDHPHRSFIGPLEKELAKIPLVNGRAICTRAHIVAALEQCRKLP